MVQAVADLRSGHPEAVRQALRREPLDPGLVGHVLPLLGRNDLFLDALRALRRVAPRATGQLLDALLDPDEDVAVRLRIPRVLRVVATQRAADGLLQALGDPLFEVRRQCALALARIAEREPSLRLPREAVFAAVRRELGAGPHAWGEQTEARATGESGSSERPETARERGLAHVFTLLSLALERDPLQIASWAVRGGDPGLRGTALEYLENVLPDDVRAALWPHLGIRARRPRSARARQQLQDELMRERHSGMRRAPLRTWRGQRGDSE
jgi:hypothetical protein